MTHMSAHAVRFMIVGFLNTILDYSLFNALYYISGIHLISANIVSGSAAILLSFLLNRNWTFADRRSSRGALRQFGRHVLTASGGLVLSTLTVWLVAHVFPAYLAKLVAVTVSFSWNFALSRQWVFMDQY